jgi:hypothetical protein
VTVLEHELGHVLGLPDNAEDGDLMDITIGPGVRRAPSSADLAAIAWSSITPSAVDVSRPLLGVAVSLSRSYPSNEPVTSAMVDAALASMLSAGAGNGDDHDPIAIPGSMVRRAARQRRELGRYIRIGDRRQR